MFVDEIRVAEQVRFDVVNGDREVAGAHEFVDDAMNSSEELLEILGSAGFFGDAVEGRAQRLGALAFRDVAVVSAIGGGAAIDEKRRRR